jgi:hypothetical protein
MSKQVLFLARVHIETKTNFFKKSLGHAVQR